MSELNDSFAKLLGRQPSDTELQKLYRVRDALGLKNNDALWLVLMALQHYQDQYERFPEAIAQAANDILVNFKATADAQADASAKAATETVSKAVAKSVQDIAGNVAIKKKLQWVCGCIISLALAFGLFGWYMHNTGFQAGVGEAYNKATETHERFAWGNSTEGALAYQLYQTGDLHRLLYCTGKGWQIKKDGYIPHPANNSVYGWLLPDPKRARSLQNEPMQKQ